MTARLGIVGCGRLAEAGYAPAAAMTKGVQIAAVADPDEARRGAVVAACETSPSAHASVEALLGAGGVDALIIASPPAHHEHAARRACAAGVPCLVEKPPAPDVPGAERIAALRPAPWVGFNRRYSLGEEIAGRLAPGGSIELQIDYRRFSWAPVSVRDPVLLDLAPHLVDLALYAGLELSGLEARATSMRPERLSVELRDGDRAASLRCASDRLHRERLTVRDRAGGVVARRTIGGPLGAVTGRIRRGRHPLTASLSAQLADLARAVAGEAPRALATATDGLAAMRIIAAIAGSLARGGAPMRVDGASRELAA